MEIERKFLLKSLPNMKSVESDTLIEQGYLSTNPEIRIRRKTITYPNGRVYTDYVLELKGEAGPDGLAREEIPTQISKEFFTNAVRFIGKPLIRKRYFRYLHDGHILECSVVDEGQESSFIYAEVEFGPDEDHTAYEIPCPGAIEVTADPNWKMKNYWLRTRYSK